MLAGKSYHWQLGLLHWDNGRVVCREPQFVPGFGALNLFEQPSARCSYSAGADVIDTMPWMVAAPIFGARRPYVVPGCNAVFGAMGPPEIVLSTQYTSQVCDMGATVYDTIALTVLQPQMEFSMSVCPLHGEIFNGFLSYASGNLPSGCAFQYRFRSPRSSLGLLTPATWDYGFLQVVLSTNRYAVLRDDFGTQMHITLGANLLDDNAEGEAITQMKVNQPWDAALRTSAIFQDDPGVLLKTCWQNGNNGVPEDIASVVMEDSYQLYMMTKSSVDGVWVVAGSLIWSYKLVAVRDAGGPWSYDAVQSSVGLPQIIPGNPWEYPMYVGSVHDLGPATRSNCWFTPS